MANFILEETKITPIRIKAIGIGGGGGKIVGRIASGFEGIDTIAIDTDVQALQHCPVSLKVQIGEKITQGIGGAGSDPEKGKYAANEDQEKIKEALKNTHIVFIIAGLGGGTGTGASPVVAKIAKDMGALVIATVTLPFKWEKRDKQAEIGLANLKANVDTLIAISNERLTEIVERDTPIKQAFARVDEVVSRSIFAVADLINKPAHIMDLDFTDIKRVLQNGGRGIVGTGIAKGEKKTVKALKSALDDPLLGEKGIQEAKNILVSIIGSPDLSLQDVVEAMNHINDVAQIQQVAFGLSIDEKMNDEVKVTLIATGIEPGKEATKKIIQKGKEDTGFFEDIKDIETPPSWRHGRESRNLSGNTGEFFDREHPQEDIETPPSMRRKSDEDRDL
ncbi:MAG: cell division protein FtsZ [Candidatus Omnitrophica bacterium]|nr:cell division protein FtsZ [Candidatus Omnitrophota bacterium]